MVRLGYTFPLSHKEDRKNNSTMCLEGGKNQKNIARSPRDCHNASENHCPAQRDGYTVGGRQEAEGDQEDTEDQYGVRSKVQVQG